MNLPLRPRLGFVARGVRGGFVAMIALVAGCGLQDPTTSDPTPPATGTSPTGGTTGGGFGDGRVFINWTIAGKPPSAAACANVAKMTLDLAYDDGQKIDIAPIPCGLTRFRYDTLAVGGATLTIEATDTSDCVILRGFGSAQITATLPSAPSPTIDLQPVSRCH